MLEGAEAESLGEMGSCAGYRINEPVTVVPEGLGNGEGRSPAEGRWRAVNGGSVDSEGRLGDMDDRADIRTEGEADGPADESGGGILTGSGKSGPFVFLRRGSLKNVVVVDTVCVVVVVAYKP